MNAMACELFSPEGHYVNIPPFIGLILRVFKLFSENCIFAIFVYVKS